MSLASKAIVLHSYGKPEEALKLETDRPLPALKDNDVLVEVHASSVNPIDWKLALGYLKAFIPLPLPTVLGKDFSGVVTAVGPEVEKEGRIRVGQEVWGDSGTNGAYATHLVVSSTNVDAKPSRLSFLEAASVPLVALTALQSLRTIGAAPGQSVLILGGSGGVGSVAIQIAKALGLRVITTTSERNIDFVTKLGADQIIDYSKADWGQVLHSEDEESKIAGIFDTVGEAGGWTRVPSVVKSGGNYVTIAAHNNRGEDGVSEQDKIYKYTQLWKRSNVEDLAQLRKFVDDGVLNITVDSVFPLEDLAAAFQKSIGGRVVGKVAIQVREKN